MMIAVAFSAIVVVMAICLRPHHASRASTVAVSMLAGLLSFALALAVRAVLRLSTAPDVLFTRIIGVSAEEIAKLSAVVVLLHLTGVSQDTPHDASAVGGVVGVTFGILESFAIGGFAPAGVPGMVLHAFLTAGAAFGLHRYGLAVLFAIAAVGGHLLYNEAVRAQAVVPVVLVPLVAIAVFAIGQFVRFRRYRDGTRKRP